MGKNLASCFFDSRCTSPVFTNCCECSTRPWLDPPLAAICYVLPVLRQQHCCRCVSVAGNKYIIQMMHGIVSGRTECKSAPRCRQTTAPAPQCTTHQVGVVVEPRRGRVWLDVVDVDGDGDGAAERRSSGVERHDDQVMPLPLTTVQRPRQYQPHVDLAAARSRGGHVHVPHHPDRERVRRHDAVPACTAEHEQQNW